MASAGDSEEIAHLLHPETPLVQRTHTVFPLLRMGRLQLDEALAVLHDAETAEYATRRVVPHVVDPAIGDIAGPDVLPDVLVRPYPEGRAFLGLDGPVALEVRHAQTAVHALRSDDGPPPGLLLVGVHRLFLQDLAAIRADGERGIDQPCVVGLGELGFLTADRRPLDAVRFALLGIPYDVGHLLPDDGIPPGLYHLPEAHLRTDDRHVRSVSDERTDLGELQPRIAEHRRDVRIKRSDQIQKDRGILPARV